MRIYIPVHRAELAEFHNEKKITTSKVFAPTKNIAASYGVTDDEEVEYAALEIAREVAETSQCQIILALEISEKLLLGGEELEPGALNGEFVFTWQDVEALYLVTGAEEELEWYDVTETQLCLSKITG